MAHKIKKEYRVHFESPVFKGDKSKAIAFDKKTAFDICKKGLWFPNAKCVVKRKGKVVFTRKTK